MAIKDWNGFKKSGDTYIPNDATARAGVTATVDLLKDTTGWIGGNEWNIKDPNIIYDASTGLTYSVLEKGYQVSNSTAAEWASLKMFFASRLKANTDYKLSTDITITSGTARIIVSGSTSHSGTYTQIVDSQNITASGKAVVDFNTGNYTWLRIVIYSTVGTSTTGNVTYDNFMITTPEQYALNPSYRPYHESVEDYIWDINAKTGVHQLLPIKIDVLKANNSGGSWDGNACTINGVTYTCTVDSNNNVTAITTSGTASGDSTFFILGKGWNYANTVENILDIGEYILSDDVNEYTGNKNVPNVRMYGYTSGGSAWSLSEITPNTNKTFTIDATAKACHISVYIRVPDEQTTNKIFKPMIRYAEDTVDKFGIYAMTNRELTDAVTPKKLEETSTSEQAARITVPTSFRIAYVFVSLDSDKTFQCVIVKGISSRAFRFTYKASSNAEVRGYIWYDYTNSRIEVGSFMVNDVEMKNDTNIKLEVFYI